VFSVGVHGAQIADVQCRVRDVLGILASAEILPDLLTGRVLADLVDCEAVTSDGERNSERFQ